MGVPRGDDPAAHHQIVTEGVLGGFMSDSGHNLSMEPFGSTRSGYRVVMQYKDDYSQYCMETSLKAITEAVAHVLLSLPYRTRKELLQKLTEVSYMRHDYHPTP